MAQNCSLPGSSVHGIFQARIPEWVAISYPRGSSQPRGQAHISCASCIGRQIPYHLCHRCLVYAKHCGPGIASHSPLIRPLGACGISLFYSPSGPEKMSDLSQVTQQLSVRKIEINKCMSHSLPEEPESVCGNRVARLDIQVGIEEPGGWERHSCSLACDRCLRRCRCTWVHSHGSPSDRNGKLMKEDTRPHTHQFRAGLRPASLGSLLALPPPSCV